MDELIDEALALVNATPDDQKQPLQRFFAREIRAIVSRLVAEQANADKQDQAITRRQTRQQARRQDIDTTRTDLRALVDGWPANGVAANGAGANGVGR